jgi:hypothetical protein
MRVTAETLILVGLVLGVFLIALIGLACSLSGRELMDCSIFRCCWKRRNRTEEVDDPPPVYATLNEFVFEASSDEKAKGSLGYLGANDMPTTMQQIFPDLLGGDLETGDENGVWRTNSELREPLL